MPIAEDYAGAGDNSSRPRDRATRVADAQKKIFRGNVDGRVREASPVPVRQYVPEPEVSVEATAGATVYVQPNDPGGPIGTLWFDTDEAY